MTWILGNAVDRLIAKTLGASIVLLLIALAIVWIRDRVEALIRRRRCRTKF